MRRSKSFREEAFGRVTLSCRTEQIMSWLIANPERSSGDIFRELQHLSSSRYHTLQICTLQRGMRKIRAHPARKPLRSSGKKK
jgi:hypothetical protein